MRLMDNKTWIIIILVSVLIGLGLYNLGSYYYQDAYNKGAEDGIRYINFQLTNQVLENGYITLNIPYQNKTYQVLMTINKSVEING